MYSSFFLAAIKPYVDNVYNDVVQNIIAHKNGVGKRIMIIAHYDVVCLMITHVDESGFLYVKPAGWIDVSIFPSRKVIIRHGNHTIVGIIGKRPVHLMRDDQTSKVLYENLWVDIGACNRAEALDKVSLGDYVFFCSCREKMPNSLITDSYLDNHVGLEILINLSKRFYDSGKSQDIYFVASNHEEIGMRGACAVVRAIKPDICICIDVTHATDYPTMNVASDGDIKLGHGCVLVKSPDVHPELLLRLEDIAKEHKIMYQVEVSPYPTGTDANIIQLSGETVQTAVVSVPVRYMHTPHEICSEKDINYAEKLIFEFLGQV